jgi:tetratricopeptide (TPR) repeat protein
MYRQAVVRDAAYASLFEEDRRTLHLAAGSWLDAVGIADLGVIAGHYELGGDREQAARAYARAAHQALYNFGQIQNALVLADRGLGCGATGVERAELLLTRAQVLANMGKLSDAVAAADEAAGLAAPASAAWVEGQRLLAVALIEAGRAAEGDARATWALGGEVGPRLSPAQRSLLLSARVRGLIGLNLHGQALAVAAEAVRAAEEAGPEGAHAMLRALDGHCFALANSENPTGAVEAGELLIEASDRAGDLHLASRARINTASSLNYLGQYEQAQARLQRALPDVRSCRLLVLEGSAIHNLGMSCARLGALDEGIDMQRQAVRIADECGAARLGINARVYETVFLVWRGHPGDLRNAYENATRVMQVTQTQPGLQTDALYALSRVQLARRHLDLALEAAGEAHRRLTEGSPVEEWSEAIRLCYIETLLGLAQTARADEALGLAHLALQQKIATIRRPDFVRSFLTRNEEASQLVHLAESRLGLRLTLP